MKIQNNYLKKMQVKASLIWILVLIIHITMQEVAIFFCFPAQSALPSKQRSLKNFERLLDFS